MTLYSREPIGSKPNSDDITCVRRVECAAVPKNQHPIGRRLRIHGNASSASAESLKACSDVPGKSRLATVRVAIRRVGGARHPTVATEAACGRRSTSPCGAAPPMLELQLLVQNALGRKGPSPSDPAIVIKLPLCPDPVQNISDPHWHTFGQHRQSVEIRVEVEVMEAVVLLCSGYGISTASIR